jgi:hypothetical protein
MKKLDALIRVRILVMSLCLLCHVGAASAQQLNLVPRFDRFSSSATTFLDACLNLDQWSSIRSVTNYL